jgi:hypothetical protein
MTICILTFGSSMYHSGFRICAYQTNLAEFTCRPNGCMRQCCRSITDLIKLPRSNLHIEIDIEFKVTMFARFFFSHDSILSVNSVSTEFTSTYYVQLYITLQENVVTSG